MANLEAAKKLVMDMTKSLQHEVIEKAAAGLAPSITPKNSKIDLSDIQLPFITTDEDVLKIIDEFQLRNPENMIRFMVEGHFAQLECISEGFDELKEIDLINSLSFVKGAKRTYKRALKNEKDKKTLLHDASLELDRGSAQLEDKALFYINKMREIDNRGKASFFFKSRISLNAVDTNNHCAKTAIKAAIEAINLQILIAAELDWDINAVIDSFEDFKTSMLLGDNCSLMHAYDDKPKEEFWLKLADRLENAIDTADTIIEFNESTEEDDYDFDNIEFN